MNQIIIAAATLVASGGGYLLAGRNERRRDERTMERELRLRMSERGAQLDGERHALQRETLLALQDAVQAMARFTGQIMHFDYMQARQGKYNNQLPGTISDDTHANLVDVRRLASRTLDSDVRGAIDDFISRSTGLSTTSKGLEGLVGTHLEGAAVTNLLELDAAYTAVSITLGDAVRREIAWKPADLAR